MAVVLRVGDTVEVAIGASLYSAEVRRVYRYGGLVQVIIDGQSRGRAVKAGLIRRVITPVLTEKERAALVALRRPQAALTISYLLEHAGVAVAPRTLVVLAKRGLVSSMRVGVSGALVWSLSPDGKRVARDL